MIDTDILERLDDVERAVYTAKVAAAKAEEAIQEVREATRSEWNDWDSELRTFEIPGPNISVEATLDTVTPARWMWMCLMTWEASRRLAAHWAPKEVRMLPDCVVVTHKNSKSVVNGTYCKEGDWMSVRAVEPGDEEPIETLLRLAGLRCWNDYLNEDEKEMWGSYHAQIIAGELFNFPTERCHKDPEESFAEVFALSVMERADDDFEELIGFVLSNDPDRRVAALPLRVVQQV